MCCALPEKYLCLVITWVMPPWRVVGEYQWNILPLSSQYLLRLNAFLPLWWNYKYDPSRVKQKYYEKVLSQCHFSHYKSHTDWLGINQGLHGEMLATNCLSHGMVFKLWSGCHISATYFWVLKWCMAIDLWKIWSFWCMCVNFWCGGRWNFSTAYGLVVISNTHWSWMYEIWYGDIHIRRNFVRNTDNMLAITNIMTLKVCFISDKCNYAVSVVKNNFFTRAK